MANFLHPPNRSTSPGKPTPVSTGTAGRKAMRPGIQGDKRFEDRGFSEESPRDKKIYDRSYKINPTRGVSNFMYEMTPDQFVRRKATGGIKLRGT